MALDTLTNVKTRLNISSSADDSLLTAIMNGADEWIRNFCQREFAGGSYTEEFPGGSEFLIVRNFPIEEVQGVYVDPSRVFAGSTLRPSDSYVVHADRGVIQSINGPFLPSSQAGLVNSNLSTWTRGPKVVRVEYSTSGEAPDDIKGAFARLVGAWYRQVKTESAANFVNVAQQKLGDSFVIYGNNSPNAIPVDVLSVLAVHRVPLV